MTTLVKNEHEGKTIYTIFDRHGRVIFLTSKYLYSLSIYHLYINYSPHTITQYAKVLKGFTSWIENSGNFKYGDIDYVITYMQRHDIHLWIEYQRNFLKNATIHNHEAVVKSFFDWLTSEEGGRIIDENDSPYKSGSLITKKGHSKKYKYVSIEQVISIINAFHNESERCLIHVLFDTGIRVSEAARLLKSDLPRPEDFPLSEFCPMIIPGSKGRAGQIKEREIKIYKPALYRIIRYHQSFDYRFCKSWSENDFSKPMFLSVTGKKINPNNMWKQIKKAAERAGLNPDDFSPHKFRHGAAYNILGSDAGRDTVENLLSSKMQMGHASIKTTEGYLGGFTLSSSKVKNNLYNQSERILKETFLQSRNHKEKRGHN